MADLVPIETAALQRELAAGLETWLERLSAHTKRSYEHGLQEFALYLRRRKLIAEGTIEHAGVFLLSLVPGAANAIVQAYLESLLAVDRRTGSPRYTRRTVKARVAAIRWAVREARRTGKIVWALDVEVPKVKKDPRSGRLIRKAGRDMRGPSEEKIAEMLRVAEVDGDARKWVVMSLIYHESLRSHEVRQINIDQIDLSRKGKEIIKGLVRKKRDEPEDIPLSADSVDAIRGWLKQRGSGSGPFIYGFVRGRRVLETGVRISETGVSTIIRELGEACEISTSPHRVRHTSIVLGDLLRAQTNAGLPDTMKRSGHKSIGGYEAYLDADLEKVRALNNAVAERVSPRRRKT